MIALPRFAKDQEPGKEPIWVTFNAPFWGDPKYPGDRFRGFSTALIHAVLQALYHQARVIVVVPDEHFRQAVLLSSGSMKAKFDPIAGVVLSSYDLPGDAVIACPANIDRMPDRIADTDTIRRLDVAFECAYDGMSK